MLSVIFLALLVAGCSQGSTPKPVGKEKVMENKVEEKGEDETKILNQVQVPTSIEELRETEPGILTSDFENETSVFAAIDPLEGIEKQWVAELKKMPKEADIELWMKALVYYLGNNAYQKTVGDLVEFEPNFPEALLPEPETITRDDKTKKESPDKAIILLDASSSMLLDVDGKQKMKIAKDAVLNFGKTIGANSELSLYIYGHAGTQNEEDMTLSCSQIDEIYDRSKYEEKSFVKAVNEVEAKGWTPLAEAIKTAHADNEKYEGNLTLYIVSDGMETCEGDPIAEAKAFAGNLEKRHVNIIGFDVDADSETQLKEVAAAGNGEYLKADSAEELQGSITKKWVPSDFDIAMKSLQSPKNSFALSFQRLEVDKMAVLIQHAISTENRRFNEAIRMAKSEAVITDEQEVTLQKEIDRHKELLLQLKDTLQAEKQQSIEDEVKRIDGKIEDWTKRMEDLK
ncbi:vWA domain-containing protein [Lederbergia lenta]|nr:VWA domain-containing protein [Lederbergia lenta]